MQYFRPVIQQATGHTPSPYLASSSPVIKLNSNENPYPPSPKVLDILKTFDGEWLRRYPDPYAQEFCKVAADILGVPSEWIVTGNGCDDLLNIIVRACVDQAHAIVYPTPTYGLYPILAELCGTQSIEIPYDIQNSLPLDKITHANGALTLIASPNSPSGHQVPLSELQQLAESTRGVLVIDEAYVDFAEESALSLVKAYEHVIVLRTMSKGYGLAGLRFGFGIAQPKLLAGLWKVKDSYGVDAIAIRVAAAAMADQAYKNNCIKRIKTSRQQLTTSLQQLGFLVQPSHGNFVLATHPAAHSLHNALRQKNIWVRHFNQPGLEDKLRITVGTPEQNQQLLQGFKSLL
ncbi:MAG: histidinol-phosphate transaminase [Leptolyngbya sp. SIO3F4]|nr:histidinol-phosphate transaminase [Leptolyngbya sp. SIO3F4]